MEPPYALMQIIPKHKQTSTISRLKQSLSFCVKFEDHRPERADFTAVHNSTCTSIRAEPDVAFFKNSKVLNCQTRLKGKVQS